ncbi:hypothetical protein DAMA08_015180 [Martiniozyma asiatica (nom. inval.)]|nr:hypothetical protein DAMA08_015180 [Martiniozyma asiatica]
MENDSDVKGDSTLTFNNTHDPPLPQQVETCWTHFEFKMAYKMGIIHTSVENHVALALKKCQVSKYMYMVLSLGWKVIAETDLELSPHIETPWDILFTALKSTNIIKMQPWQLQVGKCEVDVILNATSTPCWKWSLANYQNLVNSFSTENTVALLTAPDLNNSNWLPFAISREKIKLISNLILEGESLAHGETQAVKTKIRDLLHAELALVNYIYNKFIKDKIWDIDQEDFKNTLVWRHYVGDSATHSTSLLDGLALILVGCKLDGAPGSFLNLHRNLTFTRVEFTGQQEDMSNGEWMQILAILHVRQDKMLHKIAKIYHKRPAKFKKLDKILLRCSVWQAAPLFEFNTKVLRNTLGMR